MQVYRSLSEFKPLFNAVVTTGTFDGVHAGHKIIIDRIRKLAEMNEGESVIITFHPHPRHVLFPEASDLKLLSTIDEKIELISEAGVDHLLIIPFDREFSSLPSIDFVREILVQNVGTRHLVIGYNHQFGRNREGTFAHLREYSREYGFNVEEIPAQLVDEVSVSSTKIRQALFSGDVKSANSWLGHRYSISGKVVSGDQIGRTIGYPTANLSVDDPHKLIPESGVYAVEVIADGHVHGGMMNIGVRPTVSQAGKQSLEVHLFDFAGDLYGRHLRVNLVDRQRGEVRFSNIDEMVSQINLDSQLAKQTLKYLDQNQNG